MSRTGPFEMMSTRLPPDVFHAREPEIPILASILDPTNWVVITTDRVVWSANDRLDSVAVAAIASVHALSIEQGSDVRPDECRVIILETADDVRMEIAAEPGFALGAVWSILRHLQRAWTKDAS